MGVPIPIAMNGMDNKSRPENIKPGMARNAVNVQFSNTGEILFPNPGKVVRYAGNCKWLHVGHTVTLFVEDESLKRLNADNSATVLQVGIGSSQVFYATVDSDIYWSNSLAQGIVDNLGINRDWGVHIPPRQPDCTAVSYGGMLGGEYRVAITYLGSAGEEGGTDNSVTVTVAEGGGIHLGNFPTPPSSVSGVLVYLSSVNGEDLSLYGEFDQAVNDITLTRRICTIPLLTQFAYTPKPTGRMVLHNGRIYYVDGNRVYWTEAHKYHLQQELNFWEFDSAVNILLSATPTLYVNTLTQLYQITNIDSTDGSAAQLNALQEAGAAAGSEASDQDGITVYFMSNRGWVSLNAQGIIALLSYENVAIPFFESGTMMVTETDGLKYLTFVGQNGTANPLANSEYQASEIARGSL